MGAIDPAVTERVRQILGLRGGPLIEAEEAILPVALISGWPTLRQPNLEAGSQIPRRFYAHVEEVVAGAGSHARVGVRSGDVRALLHLTRMWAYSRDADGAVEAKIGRADTWALAAAGHAGYQDHRMPDGALVPSPIDIGSAEFAAGSNATFHGFLQVLIPGRSSAFGSGRVFTMALDEVLVSDGINPDAWTVELITADRDLIVSVEGYVFDLGR